MTTLWVLLEDGEREWKPTPGFQSIDKEHLQKIADHRNRKYCSRHYWVSNNKPGNTEYEELVQAKKNSDLRFVDAEVSLL